MHGTIAHIPSFEVQKASHMHEATAFKDAVELGSLYQHVRSCVSISISKVARVGFTTFKAWRTLDDLEQRPLLQQARSKMCFSIMEVWCKCDASIRAIRTTRALHCLLAWVLTSQYIQWDQYDIRHDVSCYYYASMSKLTVLDLKFLLRKRSGSDLWSYVGWGLVCARQNGPVLADTWPHSYQANILSRSQRAMVVWVWTV